MNQLLRPIVFAFLLCQGILPLLAQFPMAPSATPPEQSSSLEVDPLRRQTPRSALRGFLNAVQSDSLSRAAEYLQFVPPQPAAARQEIAGQLGHVFDLAFVGNLDELSSKPEGDLSDALPTDKDSAGRFEAGGERVEVVLTRVRHPAYGHTWLFSAEVVREVRVLYGAIGFPSIEANLPPLLVHTKVGRTALWVWIAFVLLIPGSLCLAWLIALLVSQSCYLVTRQPKYLTWRIWRPGFGPLGLLLAALLHYICTSQLGIPVLYRQYQLRSIQALVLVGVALMLFRLIDNTFRRFSLRLSERGQAAAQSLVIVGRKVAKVLAGVVFIVAVLSALGVETSTALAGVGIGGIALALAAQKTLENVFGGVSVLADKSIKVGDFCRIGGVQGTVEDVGLRSTSLRTLERIIVHVPNSLLYTGNLENFSGRDKILVSAVLGLRYETSPDQLRYVLASIRKLLYSHHRIEPGTARIRFRGFGSSSLDLEIFAYVSTEVYEEFLAIREDLFLRVMDIVQEAGTGFAFPSQTAYIARDTGLDPERRKAAESLVQQWRDNRDLPFPDFTPEQISKARNTVPYPPENSVAGRSS